MNFRKLTTALVLAFVVCVSVPSGYGQDQQDQQTQQPPDSNTPQAPIPPITPDAGSDGNRQQPIPAVGNDIADTTIRPDNAVLGGIEASNVVSPTGQANVLDPALNLSVGPNTGISSGQINTNIILGGTLAFDHFWARNEFTTQYSGGANLYTPVSGDNSQYHILSIADITQHQRVTLRFRDDFSDSSGSVFGGFNTGGPGLTGQPSLISSTTPVFSVDQTILTANANRLGNATSGEFDYALSRHSTLIFAGSYDLLHFLTLGYIDSGYVDGRVGYSFQVDRKNSVAITYDYNYTNFSGVTGAVASHSPQFVYGLKLSGRLALQLAGGPQLLYVQNPGASSSRQWSWNVSGNLVYRMRRTTYTLSYSHGLTNGSGVFLGALSDTITGSVQSAIHRNWTPFLTGGYSDNNNLSIDSTGSSFYGNWYGTVGLGRILGRRVLTSASYGLQRQTTNVGACPVANCGSTALSQIFTVTVNWHLRPVNLQ